MHLEFTDTADSTVTDWLTPYGMPVCKNVSIVH